MIRMQDVLHRNENENTLLTIEEMERIALEVLLIQSNFKTNIQAGSINWTSQYSV